MTTPPTIHIVVPIEGAPQMRIEAVGYEDEKALEAWLATNPRVASLLSIAQAIAEEMTT